MSIVNGSLQPAGGDNAWHTTYASSVPLVRQLVLNTQTGQYKIGDGSTALSGLTYYGGSGYTFTGNTSQYVRGDGSYATFPTAVSSFTNDAGYLTSSAIGVTVQGYSANTTLLGNSTTGSGSIVLATSPTFGTSIFSPIVYGSSSASGTLTIDSTSNATKGAITFGTASSENVYNFNIGSSSALVRISGRVGATSQAAIYFNQSSPAVGNAALYGLNTTTILNCTGGGTVNIANGGSTLAAYTNTGITWTPPAVASGAITSIVFTLPNNTGQTASTNIPSFRVTGSTKTWAAGTLGTQYFNYFTANTVAFASASTATMPVNLYVEAPLAGTNCTATNLAAIGCGGHLFIANSVGVPSNNPTGGGLLYVEAGALKYRGSSGTVTTIANA